MDAEQILTDLREKMNTRVNNSDFDKLTIQEQMFLSVWWLEAEVNNGGFHQFYFNSSGSYAILVVDALRSIGAKHTATLVSTANALLTSGELPMDRDARQALLENLNESSRAQLEQLDNKFYEYVDDLRILLFEFTQANRAQFSDLRQ